MGNFSFDANRPRPQRGNPELVPANEAEARLHRMQHLMSLKGRGTKSDDPEILKHVSRIRTWGGEQSISLKNRWGERVGSVEEAEESEA